VDTSDDILRYRALVDSMNEGFAVVDKKNVFAYVNKRFSDMLGYTPDAMIGFKLTDFLDAKNTKVLKANVKRRKKGLSSQYELFWTSRTGEGVPTIVSGAPLIDHKGKHRGSFAVILDMTAFKEAEEALARSEARYKTLVENPLQGVTVIQNGRYVYVNQAFADMVGYSVDKILEMTYEEAWELIHPDDKGKLLEYGVDRREGRPTPTQYEYRFIRKDGSLLFVEAFSSVIEYDGERALEVLIIDRTEREKAEAKQRETENLYRALIETSPDAITLADLEGNLIMANRQAIKMHGCETEEELIGKAAIEMIVPRDREFAIANLQKTLTEGAIRCVEYTMVRNDGTEFPAEISASLLLDFNGQPKAFIGVIRDITKRKHADSQLKTSTDALGRSELKYRTLAEQSMQGLTILNDNGFAYVNSAFADLVGYEIEELLAMSLKQAWDLIHPDDVNLLKEMMPSGKEDNLQTSSFEIRLLRKDGEKRWVENFTNRVEYEGTPAIQTVFVDVTHAKKAEKDVRAAKDRAHLYQDLMGHDITNQLQVILNSATLMRSATEDTIKDSFLDIIDEAVSRCARLIGEARATERLMLVPMEEKSLNLATVGCIRAISSRVKAEFDTSFSAQDVVVRADEYLELLISNLLMNAVEHNPREDKRVWVKLREQEDAFILSIADNGPGITDASKAGVFDMSRRFGGLGLHQSKQITDKYGGEILVVDRVAGDHSKGAEFKIRFPRQTRKPNKSS
ncbi:MAG: PAS domain S-box protein, partial [Candidatus Thorarchaeota archaeon]|nr:PAS domain S-box protein [Candidatus Thorarchaeota archaeon]